MWGIDRMMHRWTGSINYRRNIIRCVHSIWRYLNSVDAQRLCGRCALPLSSQMKIQQFPAIPGKNRGFGFVDFQEPEDAAAALENMDGIDHNQTIHHIRSFCVGAELMGRVIRVTIAKPQLNLKANQPGANIQSISSCKGR